MEKAIYDTICRLNVMTYSTEVSICNILHGDWKQSCYKGYVEIGSVIVILYSVTVLQEGRPGSKSGIIYSPGAPKIVS